MELEDYFKPIDKEAMQRKFDNNVAANNGDIEKFRNDLLKELDVRERKILEVRHNILFPIEIQCQNLKEQIRFVDDKLINAKIKGATNG